MPELPEVETIREKLEVLLKDHKVNDVRVSYKNFEGQADNLKGAKFIRVRRFGKVLSLDFDNGFSLVFHIKLTGQLIYKGPNLKGAFSPSKKVIGGVPGRHTHFVLVLNKGGFLYYNDYRKFGWIKVVQTKDLEKIKFLKELGPEPFKDLTFERFKNIVSGASQKIKILLMDQKKIGGVGNIYANEALFKARIDPRRIASSLSLKEIKRLYNSILYVLEKGLKYKGASELAYVLPDGSEGSYQEHTMVYGKEGQKCPRCRGVIKKVMMGGRGTYFCSSCQN